MMTANPIPAGDLLDAWEQGRDAPPGRCGLLLLALAEPEQSPEALGSWSVGRRDAALLALRGRMFGPRLTALASCPRCALSLELEFTAADVLVEGSCEPISTTTLTRSDCQVTFRLPTAADLVELAERGPDADERWLLQRCILDTQKAGVPWMVSDLPEEVYEAVAAAMAEADPQADLELSLTCPSCGHDWPCPFDIVSFLWRELDAWATGILHDIHTLAIAYGWSEPAILALPPARRLFYLEQVRG